MKFRFRPERVGLQSSSRLMSDAKYEGNWFSPWTRRTLALVLLAFIFILVLEFPFSYFFDTVLTKLGFMYSYFWALPQSIIIYSIAFLLRARWSSTVLLGLLGIVGAPIDYYLDWVVERNLISPIYAFFYVPLFFLAGASADLSLMKLRPYLRPVKASLVSAFVFTAASLSIWVIATLLFYPYSGTVEGSWLSYGNFLIPYALATGTLGGYIGLNIAKDVETHRR